jgi:hypothetical protein
MFALFVLIQSVLLPVLAVAGAAAAASSRRHNHWG